MYPTFRKLSEVSILYKIHNAANYISINCVVTITEYYIIRLLNGMLPLNELLYELAIKTYAELGLTENTLSILNCPRSFYFTIPLHLLSWYIDTVLQCSDSAVSICQHTNIFKYIKKKNTYYLRFLINRHMTYDKQNRLMCDISCQLSLLELVVCIFLITNAFYALSIEAPCTLIVRHIM